MADQAEKVVLEAEDQVNPVVDKANAGLDRFEQKAESSHGKVIRITDQTRTSIQRLIASLEKQAEAYGKSGVERLVAQRDQLLQRYAKEPAAIEAITKSYEKMIAVEEKAVREAATAKAAQQAEEALKKQSAAIKAFGDQISQSITNPIQGAGGAISTFLGTMGPFGVALAAGATAMVGLGVAGFEAAKSLGEFGTRIRDVELRTGLTAKQFSEFDYATRAVGQDISIVERLMRGLSQAADENSKEGEKARATLEKMGITLRDTSGAVRPTSEILEQIGTALASMPSALDRDAAAMNLFKRAGIEAIPVMTELMENLETARAKGWGPDEKDVQRFTQYQREVAEVGMSWDRLKATMEKPIAATVLIAIKGATGDVSDMQVEIAKAIRQRIGSGVAGSTIQGQIARAIESGFLTADQQKELEKQLNERELRAAGPGMVRATLPAGFSVNLSGWRAEVARALTGGEEGKKVEAAEKVLRDLQGQLASLEQGKASPLKEQPVVDQIEKQKQIIAGLKAQQEQTKSLVEWRKQAAEFEKRGDEAELDAIGKIYYQRDQLLQQAAKVKASESETAAIRKSADQQTAATLAKYMAEFDRYDATQRAKASSGIIGLLAGTEQVKTWQEGMTAQERIEDIGVEMQRDVLRRRAGLQAKSAATAEEAYQIRVGLALQLAQIEVARIEKEDNAAKRMVMAAEAQKQLYTDLAAAQDEVDQKRAQAEQERLQDLQRERDQIQQTASGLLHTLFTKPGEFPKQFGSTIHEAMLKPVTEGLGGMVASAVQPLIYGTKGQGGLAGIFHGAFGGGTHDPVAATADNTSATRQNSTAIMALSSVLAGFMGISAPAMAMPSMAGLTGLSVPAISLPSMFRPGGGWSGGGWSALGGGAGAAPWVGEYSPANWGGYSPVAMGGAPTVAPPTVQELANLPMSPAHAAALNPLALAGLGGGTAKSGFSLSNLKGSLGNLQNFVINPDIWNQTGTSFGAYAGSVLTSPAATTAGFMLGTSGLLGSHRGTWGGIGMGTAGGSLVGAGIGAQFGGPMGALLGAGIGAVAGFGIGVSEKMLGIETPQQKAHDDIKSIYGVDIPTNSGTIKQVVNIAQSQFGGDIAVAVRSPTVRQLVMLYSEATGQKVPLSASTPYAGSLVEQGGNLYQQASFQNNAWHTYASNLPTLGGIPSTPYPTQAGPNTSGGSGLSLALNINGTPITPEFVGDSLMAAQDVSYGRAQQAANLNVPGLMVT